MREYRGYEVDLLSHLIIQVAVATSIFGVLTTIIASRRAWTSKQTTATEAGNRRSVARSHARVPRSSSGRSLMPCAKVTAVRILLVFYKQSRIRAREKPNRRTQSPGDPKNGNLPMRQPRQAWQT